MKYNGNAKEALVQSKTYEKLVEDKKSKIFIGINVSRDKAVGFEFAIV
jgi:hypothetical protein